jgi:hypothetical protein
MLSLDTCSLFLADVNSARRSKHYRPKVTVAIGNKLDKVGSYLWIKLATSYAIAIFFGDYAAYKEHVILACILVDPPASSIDSTLPLTVILPAVTALSEMP